MIKIENVQKEFGYKVTHGSEFMWKCFGDNAWSLDMDNLCITFNPKNGEVFMLEFDTPYGDDPDAIYRWVAPEYEVAHYREGQERGYPVGNKYQCYSYSSFVKMAKAAYEKQKPDFDLLCDVELSFEPEQYELLSSAAEREGVTLEEFISGAITKHFKQFVEDGHLKQALEEQKK
jgi:hypothetical protein